MKRCGKGKITTLLKFKTVLIFGKIYFVSQGAFNLLKNDLLTAIKPYLSMWKLIIDDATMSELVKLSRLRAKLALENCQKETSPERHMVIRIQIENVRLYRDGLIAGLNEATAAP
jgi:hypothetical protein